jgi:hypothetical protein
MYATARPTLQKRDAAGRLHSEIGPAITWADGLAEWHWRGLMVPRSLIEDPSTITVAAIEAEPNLEMRRCLLERYGMERYLADSGAKEVARDDFGTLYRRLDMAFVVVENGTPDALGERRKYVLGVDSQASTAHEAVASTYGMTAEEYSPSLRT